MNTKVNNSLLDLSLANVSKTFRQKLIDTYLDIKRSCVESDFEAAGLAAGKFCEVLIRLLQHEVTGSHTPFGKPVPNMADECRKIITASNNSVPESVKSIIPRALVFLYTMRNKRGIGHIGGDIDANRIDGATIARTADWILCELIRVFHKMPIEEAQDLIDGISVKSLPIVWEVAGKKRVLKDGLNAKQKALLLLYSETESAVLTEDLCSWIEYTPSMFAKRVLDDLHQKRLIEYDRESELVYLSPKGAKVVEDELL
ncbi:hypothetical protein BKP64_15530 [Marinobacter salinus]|uniref:Uncharacterized protein n=1 Tax=Marinobacter salinus TaxID=1874317 RepID=A0A1D9GPK2_9GAMM|nr:hypothetical protein [Marinobacter salinus]AOY89464.1 hypothetical protein BKP64_15530 [Marinobacter salinus]